MKKVTRASAKDNKVLIIAHPHSGSSLLKSLLSRSINAEEIVNETQYITNDQLVKSKICVGKTPFFSPSFNLNKVSEHQLVLLIRNPCLALASLEARFKGLEIPANHKMFFTKEYWLWIMEQYIEWKGIKIRYQDMFNEEILTKVFTDVGLEVTQDIYGSYPRRITLDEIPTVEPDRTDHVAFRNYQLNTKIQYKDKDRVIPCGDIYDDIKKLDSYKKIFLE
jgi:hypothetical protein